MRKIYSLFLLLTFLGVNNVFAQTLTVTHTEEGKLKEAIEAELTSSGQTLANIKTLKIISDNANVNYNPDLVYIKNNFKTTLQTLDLSEATFGGNILPGSTDGAWSNVGAFTNMTGLTTVMLPDNLVTIKAAAFNGCTNLKTINLANSITKLESYVFRNCSKLELTALPADLVTILDYVFEKCSAVTFSELPVGLREVGKYSFNEATKVSFSEWPSTMTKVDLDAFRATNVSFNTWLTGLTTITNGVFINCYQLTNFTIPTSVTTIDQRAFYSATANNRTFTCKSETPPTAVDVNAGSLLPTFGLDPAASLITLKVLRKYQSAYASATPWSKMIIEPIKHEVSIVLVEPEFGSVTTDYTHASIEGNKLDAYEGDEINFIIQPEADYALSDVLLDGVSIKDQVNAGVLALSSIEKDSELEVVFGSTVNIENSEIDGINAYLDQSGMINVQGAEGVLKTLFDINGCKIIETLDNEIDAAAYSNAVYVLRVGNKTIKILKN